MIGEQQPHPVNGYGVGMDILRLASPPSSVREGRRVEDVVTYMGWATHYIPK